MAEFEVKANQLKRSADNENSISGRIDAIGDEIRSVAQRIQLDSSSERLVKNNLNALAENTENNAAKVKALSSALSSIAACYEQTEQRISGGDLTGRKSLKDMIKEISDKIREIENSLGMDHAAEYSDDPVNLANGNYVYEKNFFHFDTILPVNLRFFYNVKGKRDGALGTGWTHNFEKCIYKTEDTLRILQEDGSEQVFVQADGAWTACAGSFGRLEETAEGYACTDEEGVVSRFDGTGRLLCIATGDDWAVNLHYENDRLSVVDCTDHIRLSFSYDSQGRLIRVEDHTGRTVLADYQEGALVKLTDPQGNVTQYRYNEDGFLATIITPLGNVGLHNEFDSRGRTTEQIFPNGGKVKYLYDEEAGSVAMIRQNGSRVVYLHDSLYRNTKVIYPDGEETTTFDENSRKTSFTDKLGNQTRYSYDGHGRLTGLTNALGNRVEYYYTDEGQLREVQADGVRMASSEFDERGRQTVSTNARGFQTRFAYDALGRVTQMVHEDGSITSLSYDKDGNIGLVDDPKSGKTTYFYDHCHRVIRTIDALGNETGFSYDELDQMTEVRDAKGNTRTYAYDAQGNVTRVKDFNNGVISVEYDAMNKPVRVTDADGNATYYEYDVMSNVTKVTAADGSVTAYEYDPENRRTRIIYPSGGEERAVYDAAGNLLRRIAADGGEYQFSYDALGRPTAVIDPAGAERKAEFDNLGNVTAILYEDGTEEHFKYDLMGNRISWRDQSGYERYYSYDALNNLTQVRDDRGILAEYTYLPGGKLLSEKAADGARIKYEYDAVGNVVCAESSTEGCWRFTYDSLGQVTRIEHEDVGAEEYEYDAMGNVISVTDGVGNRSHYDYSPAGLLLRVTDPAGVQTGYRYDGCSRLTDILQPENGRLDIRRLNEYNRSQKEIRFTSYVRDAAGNVTSVIDPEGNMTEYGYDLCGRITSQKDAEGNVTRCTYRRDGTEEMVSFQDGRSIRYQYDALKRLAQIEDWLGVTRFERDAQGRLLQVTDHRNRTTGYRWSERGECTEILYPDGDRVSYQYDDSTHLVQTVHGEQTARYAYYENGLKKERLFQNGMRSLYSYNSAGMISELTHFEGEKLLDRYQYSYDRCGRKNGITEFHAHLPESIESRFSYSALGSLCGVEKNGVSSEEYHYDIFGNRTEAVCDGERTAYEYDRLNRMTASSTKTQRKTYTYDRRGNLSGMALNGIRKLTLRFDALNRLAEAKSDAGEAVYEYNGLDMLTGAVKTAGLQRTKESCSYDYTKPYHNLITFRQDEMQSSYVWDGELLFETGSCGAAVFLNDERMNPIGWFSDGDMQERYSYDIWGKPTAGNSRTKGNLAGFGFTGYQMDPVTGLYHAGKRKYDSESGRFIAQDPEAGSAYRPITCNPFIYCACDPINQHDPTGAVLAWLAGGIIGTAGNIAVKIAGDVVDSISSGHVSISSWQEYIGAASGGFVQGSVFVASGGNAAAAGGAGAAAETFVSNGLNMVTGQSGYRKEDGYSIGRLFMDTGKSGAEGLAAGFVFGKATKYIKIPGITSGRGNWDAVVRGKLTAAAHGYVKNIGIKTIMKGIATQGMLKTMDTILVEGKKKITDYTKNLLLNLFRSFGGHLLPASLISIFNGNRTAGCPAAGL